MNKEALPVARRQAHECRRKPKDFVRLLADLPVSLACKHRTYRPCRWAVADCGLALRLFRCAFSLAAGKSPRVRLKWSQPKPTSSGHDRSRSSDCLVVTIVGPCAWQGAVREPSVRQNSHSPPREPAPAWGVFVFLAGASSHSASVVISSCWLGVGIFGGNHGVGTTMAKCTPGWCGGG